MHALMKNILDHLKDTEGFFFQELTSRLPFSGNNSKDKEK